MVVSQIPFNPDRYITHELLRMRWVAEFTFRFQDYVLISRDVNLSPSNLHLTPIEHGTNPYASGSVKTNLNAHNI